jgi:hypothetical protein
MHCSNDAGIPGIAAPAFAFGYGGRVAAFPLQVSSAAMDRLRT